MSAEDKIENICRLCLEVEGSAFEPLDEGLITKLKLLIPELDIDASGSGRFVICPKCKETLEESHNIKKTISDNEDLIQTRKTKLNIEGQVNLDQMFNDNASEPSNVTNICRICLNSNESGNIRLDNLLPDDPLQPVLQKCLLDLNKELTADPIICETCVNKLCDVYSFITSCLAGEEKIKQYRESDLETKNLDINKVLAMLKRDGEKFDATNDFLSEFEVQDEDGTDIFDSISKLPLNLADTSITDANGQWHSEYDTTSKRPSDMPNSAPVSKKAKGQGDPTTNELLPHFKFNYQLAYHLNPGVTLHDWLAIVDMQKKKFNWSDAVTIQKVLVRMQTIPSVYNWFKSIGDIMTWDEWKNKLLQAFPTPEDYCISTKRAINRKKKATETFVDYFKDKLALLQAVDITGEKAISCIVHGLSWENILVHCLARIGNYKTTDELLDYLKICDEKHAVVDSNDQMKTTVIPATPEKTNTTKPVTKSPAKPFKPITSPPKTSEFKKVKGKCFRCMQPGHLAAHCKNTSAGVSRPKPKPAPAAGRSNMQKPNLTAAQLARRKVSKCNYCSKIGHKTRVCPHAKLAELRRLQFEVQSSKAGQQVKCVHCGQTDHASFNCPRPQSQKAKEKCSYCNKFGHTFEQCHIQRRKAQREAKREAMRLKSEATRPQEHDRYNQSFEKEVMRDQGSTPARHEREACRYCGSLTHLSSACYYSSGPGDNFSKGNANASVTYKQLLCFKCYKIGHQTENCPRFGPRSYRN